MCHKIVLTATYMQLRRLQESGAVCILTETPLSLSFWVHDLETAVAARSYTSQPPGCPAKTTPCRSSSWCPPVTSHFPKGGRVLGGILGRGALRRRRFFASSQAPRICPSKYSAIPCWAVAAARSFPSLLFTPCPPCLFPPTPSPTACSAFLKD